MYYEVKIMNTSKEKGQLVITVDGQQVASLGPREPVNIEIKEGQDIKLRLIETGT